MSIYSTKAFAKSTAAKYARKFAGFKHAIATVEPSVTDGKYIVRLVVNQPTNHPLAPAVHELVVKHGVQVVFGNAVKMVIPSVVNAVVAVRTIKLFGKGIKIEKNREERNGIKRPSIGGKCRAIWDECDALLAANNGMIPMPKALKEFALTNGYNANNAVIELYQWRKFMGFTKAKA